MTRFRILALAALTGCASPNGRPALEPSPPIALTGRSIPGEVNWGMVIHGGAGTMQRGSMTPALEAEYRGALTAALRAGHEVLAAGGSSLDAVEAAINLLEDSPLFNAGRGAVFTHEGHNELDASLMDGATRRAGAVAGLRRVRNPIDLARAVMERSPHVMMVGEGAEAFARQQGIEMVPERYFRTERRWRQLQEALEAERRAADTTALRAPVWDPETRRWKCPAAGCVDKFGTVGAVALDRHGNLAAGTSTGGMTNKRWGRVGDAPIIGAGTYADNRCGGISATGHGEFFIRSVVAYDICAISRYQGIPLRDAADQVVMEKLVEIGGEGGVIVMDPQGNVGMPFNTSGMYRGYVNGRGEIFVAIYRE